MPPQFHFLPLLLTFRLSPRHWTERRVYRRPVAQPTGMWTHDLPLSACENEIASRPRQSTGHCFFSVYE